MNRVDPVAKTAGASPAPDHAVADGNSARVEAAGSTRNIAYLINYYPKVSHSFIRREILALERHGLVIHRIAVRGWDAEVVDPEDLAEQKRTRYLLEGGPLPLVASAMATLARRPAHFLRALRATLSRARQSDRGLHYHLIYLAEACRVLELLRGTQVSHLHAHFGTNSADVAMLVRLLGGPAYSFTVHGMDEMDRGLALGLNEKVANAEFAVAVSSFTRSQLFRHVRAAHWPKVKIVHCGLDEAFHKVEPAASMPPSRLVCVGRLSEEKGHLILVEALARVVRSGVDCSLVLAGDGDLRPVIEARVRELGLEQRVTITGWVSSSRVREEILASRALVVPSFIEGLPIVIMEAMALRRPVIASSVAGIPELVRHGETGWLVPPGNVDDLFNAIINCLQTPNATLTSMAEASYQRVTHRHSVDREARKLAELFSRPSSQEGLCEWQP